MAEAESSIKKPVSKEEISFRKTYKERIKLPLFLLDGIEKDLRTSMDEKFNGNASFKKKEYGKALEHYNTGIRFCPQNTDVDLQVLCVLIGNRTTINMELECYDKVLKDISYLEEIGKYPISLKYRILWRKAKCYEARGDFEAADIYYDEALKLLTENNNLTEEELQKKVEALKSCKENKNKRKQVSPTSTSSSRIIRDIEKFKGSKKYPSISPFVDIKFDDRLGRHAVAKKDISVGTLIVKEDPHVALLDKGRSLTHCQVCFVYVDQLIVPCSTCTNVVFCSSDCKKQADASFHKIECPIYPTLISSFDKLMSLRILTQRGFEFFDEQRDKLLSDLELHYQGLTKKEVYHSDDYDNMLFLYRNVNQKSSEQLYLNVAVYLLRILKKTDFFPFETDDKVLHDEELFIGRLILRHCQLMACNVHEITQLKYPDYSLVQKHAGEKKQLVESIGVGLFPTFAFFNHACEPSIIRYSDKKRMLVRTIKPIKAGDIIYDNYGPNYLFMKLRDRQQNLKTDFFFKCTCTACVEKWPLASNLETVLKIPCKTSTCDFVFSLTRTRRPRRCVLCRKELTSAHIKETTEAIERHYNKAEKLFHEQKFDDALKAYKTVLDIKYAHTKRPDLDIVRVQERMEHIYARNGNVAHSK
nr:SET and MYND domain-containing protein 4-like isoform X2 [Leptinotarsa decemlineata]